MTFLYHPINNPKDLLCVEARTSVIRFCLRINALSSQANGKFMSPCPNPEQSKPTASQGLAARKQFVFLNLLMSLTSRNEGQLSLPGSID